MSSARVVLIIFIAGVLTALSTYAAEDKVVGAVSAELSKRFPSAKVEVLGETHWSATAPLGTFSSVVVGEENARGQVQFEAVYDFEGHSSVSYGWIEFVARVPALVVTRRVLPGEKLRADLFKTRELNVASGDLRDVRGILLSASTDVSNLEARQTLIEGQPLLSSAVEKIPDVRRGDSVRVQLISNGLVLSTRAIASETAYLDGNVRVLTDNTKRELVGKLIAPGVVEVKL